MTSVLYSSPSRRDFGHYYGPRSSRYDNQFSHHQKYVPRESNRSFLPPTVSRRSVSLNRPSPTFSTYRPNPSILDEIIDRHRHLSPATKNRYSPPQISDSDSDHSIIHRSSSRSRRLSDLKSENEKFANSQIDDRKPDKQSDLKIDSQKFTNRLINDSKSDKESESHVRNDDQSFKIEEISDSIGADQIASLADPIVTFCDDDQVQDVRMDYKERRETPINNVVIKEMIDIIEDDMDWHCNKCKDKCNGFKPHRWRSACDACKCPSNSHQEHYSLKTEEQNFIRNYVMEKPTTKKIKALFGGGGGHAAAPATAPAVVVHQHQLQQQPQSVKSSKATASSKAAVVEDSASQANGPKSPYSWIPPGLPPNKVEEYMSQLPNHKVPRTGTVGEKNREKQLMLQLPRQDLAASYCKHLTGNQEQAAFEEFVNIRNESALDIGFVYPSLKKSTECRKCRGLLAAGEVAVVAPKMTPNVFWHPSCFVCATCDELLVDLTYCINRDGKIFCERHFAETVKPRCGACDELIFAGEYTKAMNQDWHSDHFCCWQCDQVLTGQRYILRDEHPYCIKCYEEVFANTCDECGKAIGIDSKDLSYKEKHWHETCFLCSMCKISLVDKSFGTKNDRIFCANCYDQAFATRCDGCGEIFRAGMKKMEYKGKQWHDKCFCCALCKSPIGTRSFIPKNDEVYCAGCYEEKFATRCTKCRKVINSGGVTYKNEPWHRECFCCRNCNVSLAGQRFTSKDDKPYCATCFGELFAKRCTLCTKPITGIGGSKFISFEERHWHNNCFVCAQCQTSLVGQGFITDGPDILCPECAKARLFYACSMNQS